MSPEMRKICFQRTPQEQRTFDVDALTKILEAHGVPRRTLERCPACDAYKVRTEVCPMCGESSAKRFSPPSKLIAVETLEDDYVATITGSMRSLGNAR